MLTEENRSVVGTVLIKDKRRISDTMFSEGAMFSKEECRVLGTREAQISGDSVPENVHFVVGSAEGGALRSEDNIQSGGVVYILKKGGGGQRPRERNTTPSGGVGEGRQRRLRLAAPKFYAVPHNRVAEEGETVRLQCAVAGHPAPWTSWDKDGQTVTPSARLTLAEKDDLRVLQIDEVTPEDAGLYRVTLENEVGRVEASARLEVIGYPGDAVAIQHLPPPKAKWVRFPTGSLPDEAAGRRVFSGISRFAPPFHSVTYLHIHLASPSSVLETSAAHNIEVLRADEDEAGVRMEQRRNERGEGKWRSRENPPASGVVRHDFHMPSLHSFVSNFADTKLFTSCLLPQWDAITGTAVRCVLGFKAKCQNSAWTNFNPLGRHRFTITEDKVGVSCQYSPLHQYEVCWSLYFYLVLLLLVLATPDTLTISRRVYYCLSIDQWTLLLTVCQPMCPGRYMRKEEEKKNIRAAGTGRMNYRENTESFEEYITGNSRLGISIVAQIAMVGLHTRFLLRTRPRPRKTGVDTRLSNNVSELTHSLTDLVHAVAADRCEQTTVVSIAAALCGWVRELNRSIRASTFQGSVQTCLLRPWTKQSLKGFKEDLNSYKGLQCVSGDEAHGNVNFTYGCGTPEFREKPMRSGYAVTCCEVCVAECSEARGVPAGRHGVTSRGLRAWSASPRSSPSYSRRLAPSTARVGGRLTLACDLRGSPSPVTSWYRSVSPRPTLCPERPWGPGWSQTGELSDQPVTGVRLCLVGQHATHTERLFLLVHLSGGDLSLGCMSVVRPQVLPGEAGLETQWAKPLLEPSWEPTVLGKVRILSYEGAQVWSAKKRTHLLSEHRGTGLSGILDMQNTLSREGGRGGWAEGGELICPDRDSSPTGILSAAPCFSTAAGTDQGPGLPRIRQRDQTPSGPHTAN
ncbi:hypothetical protein PR048_003471 [Dryococelus australis]|uniref:Ig-like domain-containing protein n=1 Tax=Dryococelus australis TaxID=614101 RepID=A0ABQ9IN45_9NEOP|nr:hypothetical protein PR048_003471 [Dryococelus australis]